MPTWCSASQLLVQDGAITLVLLFVNNSAHYFTHCVHVVLLLPQLLFSVIIFDALLYLRNGENIPTCTCLSVHFLFVCLLLFGPRACSIKLS